ncbi:GntR family transcriptional regulator [Orbaceae bacterium ac157xtp]
MNVLIITVSKIVMGVPKLEANQKSIASKIRDELKNDILGGIIAPGTRLNQKAIAERFNTSRIPVREALNQLEAQGLVKAKLNHGAVVASPSIEDICDLLDIRIALECRAAKLAVPKMTKEDFERLSLILKDYNEANNPIDWAEINRHFHLALCEPANNKQLTALIKLYCMSTSSPYANFHLDMTNATNIRTVCTEHQAILDACKAKNVNLVISLLEEHIQATKDALLHYQNHSQ